MNNQRNGRRSNLCFRWLLSALVLLGVVGFVSTLAWTQVTSGSLTGLVTDPSGAVVPGAKVVLTDTNKGYDYPAGHRGFRRSLCDHQSSPQHLLDLRRGS